MMNIKHIALVMFCAGCAATASAQELSGSLTATGDYKAEIRPHSRLSGLPYRLETKVPEGKLPVAIDGLPVSLSPYIDILPAAAANTALPERYRGYAALTSGSYLNTSLSAGYRFVDEENTTFGAWLQHSSSSLFRPKTHALTEAERKKLYDETVSLYWAHQSESCGSFNASATYHLGYFNYYSDYITAQGEVSPAPTQTLNDFMFSAAWKSVRPSDSGLFGNIEVDYRYFGYRDFYLPFVDKTQSLKPTRENDINYRMTLGYSLSDAGSLSLGANLRMLMYSNANATADEVHLYSYPSRVSYQALKTLGIVTLKPGYSLTGGNWSLRAGAQIDISWGVASDTKFKPFHIAPDVAVSYSGKSLTAYLRADGGVTPNTLSSRADLDMYQSPSLINTLPQYTPLNLTLGVKTGNMRGLRAGAHISYAIADNSPIFGWYPFWLHGIPFDTDYTTTMPVSTISLKGFSLGADLEYTLANILNVNGAFTYQRQHGEIGYFNGVDRPRWTADISAEVTPLTGLAIGADFHYRGVRNIILAKRIPAVKYYAEATGPDHNFTEDKPEYISCRLADVYDLGVYARYTLNGRYTFSLATDNILGSKTGLCPIMPTEGIVITGGVAVVF